MSKEEIRFHLTPEQMRQLARYELTFREVLPEDILVSMVDGDIEMPDEDGIVNDPANMFDAEVYTMTLEDLTAALHNLQAADPAVVDFYKYWLCPLSYLEYLFDLDHAMGYDEDLTPDRWIDRVTGIMQESSDCDAIWWILQDVFDCHGLDEHLSEIIDYDKIDADLARHAQNRALPMEQWSLTKEEMENCIHPLEDDDLVIQDATAEERALCRRMIEELIQMDSRLALHVKGYACYGGNALYECDWLASRDCITRLYDMTDSAGYANTLGYIYYYGRCNNGVPEYDKAFRYYEVAAANGLHEGLYKLADMYWHGYGCKKSPGTAHRLYRMVYDDCYRQYLTTGSVNFADAALRMGNVFAQGIDVTANPTVAYYYYLQADYAARQRVEEMDFFGNTTVVINARKALEEAKQDLPEDYLREYYDDSAPSLFYDLMRDRYRCVLSYTRLSDEEWELRATRIKPRSYDRLDRILVTIPEIGLIDRTTEVTMRAVGVTEIWFSDDSGSVRYDAIEWNYEDDRYEFYYDDTLVGWIKCEAFRVYGQAVEEPHGAEYHLVSICFHPGGRSYDYLCDLEAVQVGDTVIVNGYDGETEVEVVSVRTVRESELGLPVDRYKKVVRKAD